MDNWQDRIKRHIDSELRPRSALDAFGLAFEFVSIAAFIVELVVWPPDALNWTVLIVRVVTLLVGVVGWVLRRVVRREPFDYSHWL